MFRPRTAAIGEWRLAIGWVGRLLQPLIAIYQSLS
jgi:hypothetical protein